MASYKEAVNWIASEDAPGDTPAGMEFSEAVETVDGMMTVEMAANLWGKDTRQVAVDVVKARGFKMPRGFLSD